MTSKRIDPDVLAAAFVRGDSLPGTLPDQPDAEPALVEALSSLAEPATPPTDLLDSIEAALDRPNLPAIRTLRAADGEWIRRTDKIWKKVLSHDPDTGQSITLVRCAPGAIIPAHVHERAETVVMLEGEYRSPDGVIRAGDVQICPAGSYHHASVTPAGCLLLVHR